MRSGDVLFFYMSKDPTYAASQSITTVGVAEQITNVTTQDDLIRLTAKHSAFSADDLREMKPTATSPVKMIDFLLVGHSEPPVKLDTLIGSNVFFNRPPQSIAQLREDRYARLKLHLRLGFDV
jgi:hypothetical protein